MSQNEVAAIRAHAEAIIAEVRPYIGGRSIDGTLPPGMPEAVAVKLSELVSDFYQLVEIASAANLSQQP